MFYIIILFVILIGIYRYDYCKIQKGRLFLWVVLWIIFICIAGFRFRMGGDTVQYMAYYDKVNTLPHLRAIDFSSTRYAPGFVFLASLCKTISPEFILMQFVVALVINTAVFYFFWKNTDNIYFGLLFYSVLMYLNLNMEVIRETMAVSVFLFSWPLFRDGKWLPYYLCALFAILFHISAACLLLLPIINIPGIRHFFTFGNRLWYFMFIVLFLGLTINYLFIDFVKAIAFTETMMDQAKLYSRTELAGAASLNIGGALTKLLRYVAYPAVAIYFINKNIKEYSDIKPGLIKMERISICSIYISLISVGVFILQRYNNYLFFFPCLLMSDWIFSILDVGRKKIRLKFLTWALIFFPFFFISFYSYYFNNVNREGSLKTYMIYYPYKSWFEKEMDPDREKVIKYLK